VNPEKFEQDWKYVTYLVFDAPARSSKGMKYEERVNWMEENIKPQSETTYAAVVGVCKCTGDSHLQKMLKQVLMKGGEGIMLRQPKSLYEHCRSHTLLKVKFFHDEECKVIGHENGSGRCQNMMGKIKCILPNGVEFKIGSGFSDAQRKKPPKINSVVTFKYQEMSDHGHPRFPVFLRERGDMTWEDVLANAKTKAPFSSLKKGAKPLLQKQHSILFSTIPSRDQVSGKKIVTMNDADEDAEEAAAKGLLLTKANGVHGAGAGVGGVGKKRGLAAVSISGKQVCRWHPACYRKNKEHLEQYDHPAAVEGSGDGDDDEDGDNEEEDEPRNKDMPDDPKDADYEDGVGNKKKNKKPKTSPSPPATSAAAASPSPPSPSKAVNKVCWYGEKCYNKDPDHIKNFTHPLPNSPKIPTTKEEFIKTTNQSQHDLAEYYQFGGDEDEEEVKEMLVADRNERRLSIQKYNENKSLQEQILLDEEELDDEAAAAAAVDEVKTVFASATSIHKKNNGDNGYLLGCASDDDDDMEGKATVAINDFKPKIKPVPPKVYNDASSTAETIKPSATTRQPSARIANKSSASASPPAVNNNTAANCPFLLPELLAKPSRIIETDEGEELCKKCKFPIGDHRETR
jgi:hypothetical protein